MEYARAEDMSRREFPVSVKREALKRSGGFCEISIFQEHKWTQDIKHNFPETCDRVAKELDHILANDLQGDPTIENAAYLCRECHKKKTRSDKGYMAKRRRSEINRDRPAKRGPKQKMVSRKNPWPPNRKFQTRPKGE